MKSSIETRAITQHTLDMKTQWRRLGCLALTMLLLPLSAQALEPEPFEMEMEGRFYFGVGVRLSGSQTLEYRGDDVWRLKLEARGPFTRLDERSDFRWVDGEMTPLSYRYRLRAPFEREERRVRFEPENDRIRAIVNGSTTDHDYNPNWHDPMSYTFLLLRDVEQGNERAEYEVVDRHDARTYVFEKVESDEVPSTAVIMSQVQPDRGTIYMITDTERMLPSHLIRWDDGSIEYQIQTKSATRGDSTYEDFPHWPNPRRNRP